MPTLTPEQIYQICLEVGFSPDQAVTWTAIAMAESGGNTHAHNPNGEDSWGLWQVNVDPNVRGNPWGDLTDPRNNARAAFEISGGGERMSPWTVTHDRNRGTDHDYRNFLDDARAASGGRYEGDNRGVTGYGGGPSTPGADADGVAPTGPPGDLDAAGADAADVPGGAGVQAFLDHALAQTGDTYVFGHETDIADVNPETFDCSELVQWAAGQVGVEITDGSWLQYLALEEQGATMSVEEALQTPGALLFSFSSDPTAGGGRPSSAHVAISLGDGTTIEARGTRYGVGSWEAGDRFEYAAVIPQLGTAVPPAAMPAVAPTPVDTDGDLLEDYDEMSRGTDPGLADTDADGLLDGFEITIGTDALRADTDSDGLDDAYELSRSRTNALAADTDADGVADNLELAAGTDAVEGAVFTVGGGTTGTATANALGLTTEVDTDADGLSDVREGTLGSNAADADTDRDGLNDGLELAAGTNLLKADSDSDGLSDAFELSLGTDPLRADTDGDGLFDGAELAGGSDALVSALAVPVGAAAPGGGLATAPAPPPAPTVEYETVIGSAADTVAPVVVGPPAPDVDEAALGRPDDDDDDDPLDGIL